jgi:hypothetical protein
LLRILESKKGKKAEDRMESQHALTGTVLGK